LTGDKADGRSGELKIARRGARRCDRTTLQSGLKFKLIRRAAASSPADQRALSLTRLRIASRPPRFRAARTDLEAAQAALFSASSSL
jgi:hypothetical protein